MTDLEARLRAMNKPCPTAALPDRAMLAARARRRTLRAGTLSGSALAGVVALVAATMGGNAYHSMELTTTPPPTATSTPVAGAPTSTAPAVPAGRTKVLPRTGTRATRSLAEPPAAARSATPSPAGPSQAAQEELTPTFWRGAYGPAGFYGVQLVEGTAGDVCAENTALLLPGSEADSHTCYRLTVTPPQEQGGGFLTEVAVCRTPSGDGESYSWDGGAPHTYAVHDAETDATVRTWRPPSTSEPYALSPGNCAFYLWHLLAMDDAGRPLPSGRTYYALVDAHHEVELRSAEFPVPR